MSSAPACCRAEAVLGNLVTGAVVGHPRPSRGFRRGLPLPDPPLADAGAGIVWRPWGGDDAPALAAAWADAEVAAHTRVPADTSVTAAARWVASAPPIAAALDENDSPDDATWTPFAAFSRHLRQMGEFRNWLLGADLATMKAAIYGTLVSTTVSPAGPSPQRPVLAEV